MAHRKATHAENASKSSYERAERIAIVGMSGRFPGANDVEQFWTNLAHGVESITILTQEEMRSAGIPETISKLPGYVNASPVLDGVDQFDASFFGFSARDATLTDPQHRLFLETAWQALEDSGYDPECYPGPIGIFGGCELSGYLGHLYQNLDSLKYIDGMQLMVTNDKDHLCTQVSYRLNLRGPSVVVQTTCSTSLVAVALACESLQQRRCDMALAGGVTVKVPQRGGYYYVAGSILSPDGHCRPFDAQAQGTIVGSGVGLVVLKRLADALVAGDNIRAVILGTGINNDGNDKVGYTAPSRRGQAAAIRAAHRNAGICAESIGYLEAHGTGTILGDPIELSALTEVFRESTARRGFCAIGSAKSNFGHLSCAAGVTGLIKTVLALENEAIPPTLHYTAPNPAIDLNSSPFYVATRLRRWDRNGIPRRAGISSFGVGGTNAHVILEEAPERAHHNGKRPHQLFTLSARSEPALNEVSRRLAAHLRSHPEINLADAAFTLHMGRRSFKYRRAVVASSVDREGLTETLASPDKLATFTAKAPPPIVFLFPGQGSQYPGMAAGLYKTEPVVRHAIDRCARILQPTLSADLRKLLFPSSRYQANAAEALKDTKWAQPALFTVGYALSELWASWGVKPAGMIGHSIGEYVAATLAGVMTLEDALMVIARRGQLISELPRGSMLAVMTSADKIEHLVNGKISIAARNAPGFTVLSGPDAEINTIQAELEKRSMAARRLHTSHAFHSCMMDPILNEFEDIVSRINLSVPRRPFVSTLDGRWAEESVTTPSYWSRQVRQPVLFGDGMQTLFSSEGFDKSSICIEAGPGNTLSTFAREIRNGKSSLCLASLPSPGARRSDTEEALNSLGQLWTSGVEVVWDGFHRTDERSRVSLPTYPFERQTYWVGVHPSKNSEPARDPFNWFYRAAWREESLAASPISALARRKILVLDRESSPGLLIANRLRELECDVVTVRPGDAFAQVSESEYALNPDRDGDFGELAAKICQGEVRLSGVIDCWGATSLAGAKQSVGSENADKDLNQAALMSLLAPMRLAQGLSVQQTIRPLPMLLLAVGTTRVSDRDVIDPSRALGAGVARVLPQEHPGLRVAHIDADEGESVTDAVIRELAAGAPQPAVAIRSGKRFVEAFEPVPIRTAKSPADLPPNPVILITGGLGHMGINLAEALFTKLGAKLILVGRSPLPQPDDWKAASNDPQTPPHQKVLLQRLANMRATRDELIVVPADMNKKDQVKAAVDAGLAHFERIDVVVHGAARIDAAAFGSIAETGWNVVNAQFSPKLYGLLYLMDAFRDREPRRWILHSSISCVLGGLGLAAYAGVNAMLDALALQHGPTWLSIDWDAWDNAAEGQSAAIASTIRPPEGSEVLLRLMGQWEGCRAVVAINLAERLKAWVHHTADKAGKSGSMDRHPRPNLTTALVEPRTETERLLAEIWASQLGLDSIGIHDRFFELGGHSLLAAQIASEICDRFQIELPVLKIFEAPTIGELSVLVDQARSGGARTQSSPPPDLGNTTTSADIGLADEPQLEGSAPEVAAKTSYRNFYNNVTRQLEQSGLSAASFFLNYGYVSLGEGDEAQFEVAAEVFNGNSVRLAFELVGGIPVKQRKVLDVGCGRGGTVVLLAETFGGVVTGVDLSPEAIAFCRKTHDHGVRFEVGDAEHLPFEDRSFEVVTNIESSHTYPNLRAFFTEVGRILMKDGIFLYTDLLPVQRWAEVRILLESLGMRIESQRDITPNVLRSCDEVAAQRVQAFGGSNESIDNFLAVPGSVVYENMASGAWEYQIVRARRA